MTLRFEVLLHQTSHKYTSTSFRGGSYEKKLAEDTARYDPVVGGISTGRCGVNSAGTLGSIWIDDDNGDLLALSNERVFGNAGTRIAQQSIRDGDRAQIGVTAYVINALRVGVIESREAFVREGPARCRVGVGNQ